MANSLALLVDNARACRVCADVLPHGPRPILAAQPDARIAVIGQAPGRRVHQSGIPWEDASGERLRHWMGISSAVFYDPNRVAILPMGFCFPGTGTSGDLPPRPECAPLWMDQILLELDQLALVLVIGQYAQERFLGAARKRTLTDTVCAFADYPEELMPLPHPSPRNNIWLAKNPFFTRDVVPTLQARVGAALT